MSRLIRPLLLGLLCTATHSGFAQEPLTTSHPERLAVVSAARQAMTADLPPAERVSLRKVWTSGQAAYVCAVRTDAQGQPLMKQGDQLLERVVLRRAGQSWQVQRTERLAAPPTVPMDAACGQRATADVVVAAAIQAMEANPPGAGRLSAAPSEATGALAGVVSAAGRTLLHDAPDLGARMGKHLVGGDKVRIEAQRPGWTRVRYTHPITGVVTVGWVISHRVKSTEVKAADN